MALFTENLPVVLVLNKGKENEQRLQGRFLEILSNEIALYIPAGQEYLHPGLKMHCFFLTKEFEFEFITTVLRHEENRLLMRKPRIIHKKNQRESLRLQARFPAQFTIWTEQGEYQGNILDISSTGCKLRTKTPLEEGQVISINSFIADRGPDAGIRLISQALTVWRKPCDEHHDHFVYGCQFTTLSTEDMNKLESFINENLNKKEINQIQN